MQLARGVIPVLVLELLPSATRWMRWAAPRPSADLARWSRRESIAMRIAVVGITQT